MLCTLGGITVSFIQSTFVQNTCSQHKLAAIFYWIFMLNYFCFVQGVFHIYVYLNAFIRWIWRMCPKPSRRNMVKVSRISYAMTVAEIIASFSWVSSATTEHRRSIAELAAVHSIFSRLFAKLIFCVSAWRWHLYRCFNFICKVCITVSSEQLLLKHVSTF